MISRQNPFPVAAVSSRNLGESIGLDTPPVVTARRIVTDYLDASNAAREGISIAIVGEFGSGKSHLALTFLHDLGALSRQATTVYIDAPADSFMRMYQERFLVRFNSAAIRDLVARVYSRRMADELAESELTEALGQQLREGTIDGVEISDELGLPTNNVNVALAEQLSTVTEDEQFATALALSLKPEFEASVWQWLGGAEPTPALRERGVNRTLSSESDAMLSIGVLALLHSLCDIPFGLVIDELEKILTQVASESELTEAYDALKLLIDIFRRSGGMLILSGLPEYLELMPADCRQRLTHRLELAPFEEQDLADYIRASNARSFGSPALDPYNLEAVQLIATLSSGNPRQAIRLLHSTYNAFLERGGEVDIAIVRDVAQAQLTATTAKSVRETVVGVLERNGLRYIADHHLSRSKRSRVDLWVPVLDKESPGVGIAIIFAHQLLDKQATSNLVSNGAYLSDAIGDKGEIVLVTTTLVPDFSRKRVDSVFDLVFSAADVDFSRKLESLLMSSVESLRTQAGATQQVMAESLLQIQRQNQRIYGSLEELLRSKTSSGGVEQAAERGLRRVLGQLATAQDNEERFPTGFDDVERLFDHAMRSVDASLSAAQRPLSEEIDYLFSGKQRRIGNGLDEIATDVDRAFLHYGLSGLSQCLLKFREQIVIVATTLRWEGVSSEDEIRRLCVAFDDFFREALTRGASSLRLADGRSSDAIWDEFRSLGQQVFFATRDAMERLRR